MRVMSVRRPQWFWPRNCGLSTLNIAFVNDALQGRVMPFMSARLNCECTALGSLPSVDAMNAS